MNPDKLAAQQKAREMTGPGRPWRFLAWYRDGNGDKAGSGRLELASAEHPAEFDELVVGSWLHVEQMNDRDWWVRVGPVTVNARIHPDGTCDVIVEGETSEHYDGVLARYVRDTLQATEKP